MNEGMIIFLEMLVLTLIVFFAGWNQGYEAAQKKRNEKRNRK